MCTSMCAEGGGLFTWAGSHRVSPGWVPLPAAPPGAAACLLGHLRPTGSPHAKRLIGPLKQTYGRERVYMPALGAAGAVLKETEGSRG